MAIHGSLSAWRCRAMFRGRPEIVTKLIRLVIGHQLKVLFKAGACEGWGRSLGDPHPRRQLEATHQMFQLRTGLACVKKNLGNLGFRLFGGPTNRFTLHMRPTVGPTSHSAPSSAASLIETRKYVSIYSMFSTRGSVGASGKEMSSRLFSSRSLSGRQCSPSGNGTSSCRGR